jgi:hypothetical protein
MSASGAEKTRVAGLPLRVQAVSELRAGGTASRGLQPFAAPRARSRGPFDRAIGYGRSFHRSSAMRIASILVLLASCVPLPEQPLVTIGPDGATTVDDLVLEIAEPPAQRDDVTYAVSWARDGAEVASLADALTVPASETAKGQRWRATVTPSNRRDREGVLGTAEIVIANTPPVGAAVAIAPAPPTRATGASAAASGTDVDDDALTWSYAWTLDGAAIGADAATIDGALLTRGATLRVTATPSDGEATGQAVSAEVVVGNTPPSLSAVSLAPMDPRTLSVLTATATGAFDLDGDAVEVVFAFFVDGALASEVRSANGTATLDGAVHFSKGKVVSVTATPTDGADVGSPVSSDPVTVLNTPPTAPAVAIAPDEPSTDAPLVCEVTTKATDVDGDALTYDFTWARDGAEWTGPTSRTFYDGDTVAAAELAGGQRWTCTAMAWDGEVFGPDATSAEVTVATCGNPGGGSLSYDNGAGTGTSYCYDGSDSVDTRARKACESHFGVGRCCIIPSGYRGEQWGECGMDGGSGTIHWHPDSWPSGHCGPTYAVGDVVSPGWCGSIIGRFMP